MKEYSKKDTDYFWATYTHENNVYVKSTIKNDKRKEYLDALRFVGGAKVLKKYILSKEENTSYVSERQINRLAGYKHRYLSTAHFISIHADIILKNLNELIKNLINNSLVINYFEPALKDKLENINESSKLDVQKDLAEDLMHTMEVYIHSLKKIKDVVKKYPTSYEKYLAY